MRLSGYLVGFALAILLASTTPVGTGSGAHQFDLLHPLFSHVHLVNGRLVSHEELARELSTSPEPRATPGPALGSGNPSGSPDGGLGISPIGLPHLVSISTHGPVAFVVEDASMPRGHEEAPPEPPPL